MDSTTLVIFILTYIGIAIGEIPGLALDRTGIALLGAIAMVVTGVLSTQDAVLAIDMPTILLLYGLMVVSAQFRLGGFYTHVALAITRHLDRPRLFLLLLMFVSAGLSALLANDIVCLAFAPVLTVALVGSGLNPVPFLIGLACSSNIGSAATIIGNPQNMLIGQIGGLHFGKFFAWCLVPSALSLLAAYGVILLMSRAAFKKSPPAISNVAGDWPPYNSHQSFKGIMVTVVLVALFFTPIPRQVSAVAAAGFLLCSRKMTTRSVLGLVDWHLITLFCALFIVMRGIETTNFPDWVVGRLGEWGWDFKNLFALTGISVVLSNLVSNVPATMLLVRFLDPANPISWYVLALSSTFAGNLITIGSIANLIVIEQARAHGVKISFRDHARLGIPVTLVSITILCAWIVVVM